MQKYEVEIRCTVKSWTIFHDVEAESFTDAEEIAIAEIQQDHIEVDQNDIELSFIRAIPTE